MAGYSGTPLGKKLGLKPPLTLVTYGAPPEYADLVAPLPEGVAIVARANPRGRKSPNDGVYATPRAVEAVHVFTTKRAELEEHLVVLRRTLVPAGFVWVSWPKKSAKVPTDVTEDTIRDVALPLGLVDVKVCAVTDVWSGLKLVIRKSERP